MEEWKNKYRNALQGHEMSTPEGLWNEVSSKIAEKKRRRNIFIYSLSAAAAVVLAVFILRPSTTSIVEPINNTAENVSNSIINAPVQVITPSKPKAVLASPMDSGSPLSNEPCSE